MGKILEVVVLLAISLGLGFVLNGMGYPRKRPIRKPQK